MTRRKTRRVNLEADPCSFEQPPIYYTSEAQRESFSALNESVRSLYPEGISDSECEDATRNLVGFGKLLLQIKRRQETETQNKQDEAS